MSSFTYAKTPNKLEGFLQDIQRSGKPEKASTKWLKSSGYTSSNDVSMLNVLEYIGFVNSSRVPTDAWQAYRDQAKSRQVLARSIREGYGLLFEHYPDADTRTADDLSNFFRANSALGEKAISLMVRTFQALCELADFGGVLSNGAGASDKENGATPLAEKGLVTQPQPIESPTPALHIDFQVHIAADAPPEQIDQIFESMAKHLYGQVAK